jgi:hypothetical protein
MRGLDLDVQSRFGHFRWCWPRLGHMKPGNTSIGIHPIFSAACNHHIVKNPVPADSYLEVKNLHYVCEQNPKRAFEIWKQLKGQGYDWSESFHAESRFIWLAWGKIAPYATLMKNSAQIREVIDSKPVFFYDGRTKSVVRDVLQMSWPVHPRAANFSSNYTAGIVAAIASCL